MDGDDDDAVLLEWYPDGDGDLWGGSALVEACEAPDGFVAQAGDCDDGDAAISPTAREVCDGADNDCNGLEDDGEGAPPTWYADGDADGWGADPGVASCESPGGDWSERGGDCDDRDPEVNPGVGAEDCATAADDDCDGSTNADGAAGCADWYPDMDGDATGSGEPRCLCGPDGDWRAATDDDCDDGDPSAHPGAEEVCDDGVDQDCDADPTDCRLSGELSLAGADAVLYGELEGASDGVSVRSVDDPDGDGYDDVVVGSLYGAQATLLRGPLTGDAPLSGGDAFLRADPNYVTALTGWFLGDADGDGADDLALAAYDAEFGGYRAGRVYLLPGPVAGPVDLDAVAHAVDGSGEGALFGLGLDGGFDLDGDGQGDLAMGATGASAGGTAYVFTDPFAAAGVEDAGFVVVGDSAGDSCGYSLAGVRDVDGDGSEDLAVGARESDLGATQAGAVAVFRGPLTGSFAFSDADTLLLGVDPNDRAGSAVDGGEDGDGDGRADLLVGALDADSGKGSAYLVGASTRGVAYLSDGWATLEGVASGDYAGFSVRLLRDQDGDGLADSLVGAHNESTAGSRAGAVYLVYSPVGGTLSLGAADARWTGESAGDGAGVSVDGSADISGDGIYDLLIGAPYSDRGDSDAGAAFVVFGTSW